MFRSGDNHRILPDLSPCDYGCFHQLKNAIGGVAYPDKKSLEVDLDKEIEDGNAAANIRQLENYLSAGRDVLS